MDKPAECINRETFKGVILNEQFCEEGAGMYTNISDIEIR